MGISRLVSEVTAFASVVALSRLLEPAQIGQAVVALVVFALASGLLFGSFGSPLIQEASLTHEHAEVAMLMSVGFGLVLSLLCALVGLAARLVVDDTVANMVVLAAPAFLVGSLAVVPQALRSRHLAFQSLMVIDVTSVIVGAIASVALAVGGLGAAAIVLGQMIKLCVVTMMSLTLRGAVVAPRWHRALAGPILRFGSAASGQSIFYTLSRNVDYALLTTSLSSAAVGFYYRAFTLAVDYQSKISSIVVRILFPLLSQARAEGRFRDVRKRVVRLHSVVLFPLLGTLLVTAPDVIPLLYGSNWDASVEPARILVAAGFATVVATGIGPIVLAAGHPTALLINNIVAFLAFVILVLAFAPLGLTAVCIAVSVFRVVIVALSQYFLGTRLLGISLVDTLVIDPGPAAVGTAALVGAGFAANVLVQDTPNFVDVVVCSLAGFGAYALTMRLLFRSAWNDMLELARRFVPRLRRRSATAPSST